MANHEFPIDRGFEEEEDVIENEMEDEEVSDEEISDEEDSVDDEEDWRVNNEEAVFRLELLKLPANAIQNVLHNMDIIEIIAYSLCSESTKQHIADMNLEVHASRKSIDRTLEMYMILDGERVLTVIFSNNNRWKYGDEKIDFELEKPRYVELECRGDDLEEGTIVAWENKLTYFEWLEHFSDVFVCYNIELLRFYKNSERFNIVSLCDPFQITDDYIFYINGNCSDFHRDQLLQRFKPIKRFHLNGPLFSTLPEHHRFISENYDLIEFHREAEIGLDNMLLCNSAQVRIFKSPKTSVKEINRFFKLWIRGGNRRLKCLSIVLSQGLVPDKDALLKGIKYQVLPEDREESFKVGPYRHKINGGIEIYSKAGRRANIQVSEKDGQNEIEMFLLP